MAKKAMQADIKKERFLSSLQSSMKGTRESALNSPKMEFGMSPVAQTLASRQITENRAED